MAGCQQLHLRLKVCVTVINPNSSLRAHLYSLLIDWFVAQRHMSVSLWGGVRLVSAGSTFSCVAGCRGRKMKKKSATSQTTCAFMYEVLPAVSLCRYEEPLSVTHLLARNSSDGNSELSSGTPLLTTNRLRPFSSLDHPGKTEMSFQEHVSDGQSGSHDQCLLGNRLATVTLGCKAS